MDKHKPADCHNLCASFFQTVNKNWLDQYQHKELGKSTAAREITVTFLYWWFMLWNTCCYVLCFWLHGYHHFHYSEHLMQSSVTLKSDNLKSNLILFWTITTHNDKLQYVALLSFLPMLATLHDLGPLLHVPAILSTSAVTIKLSRNTGEENISLTKVKCLHQLLGVLQWNWVQTFIVPRRQNHISLVSPWILKYFWTKKYSMWNVTYVRHLTGILLSCYLNHCYWFKLLCLSVSRYSAQHEKKTDKKTTCFSPAGGGESAAADRTWDQFSLFPIRTK